MASVPIGVVGAVAAVPAAHRAAEERYFLMGEEVTVENLVGAVRVGPGPGPAVEVVVAWRGEAADHLALRVDRDPAGDALRVRPTGRTLFYPWLTGRRDTVVIRIHRDRLEPGRIGLFGGRTVRIFRAGDGPLAFADLTVRIPAGRRVTIRSAVGSIEARGVEAELRLISIHSPVVAAATRGTLRASTHSAPVAVRGAVGGVSIDTREGWTELTRTRGARLVAETTAGSISAEELDARALRLQTQAGSIDLHDARADRIVLDGGAGSIAGDDLEARELTVDLEAGDLDLAGVRADRIALDVGRGDVALSLRGTPDSLVIDAGGAVLLRAPADLDARLGLRTSKGGIRIEFPGAWTRATESEAAGRVGRGRGRISITARRGIRIVPAPARDRDAGRVDGAATSPIATRIHESAQAAVRPPLHAARSCGSRPPGPDSSAHP